ncbi:MAG: diaminopimelate epimerase [Holosporaceae bacterium]|jgi:diaminopimelate epimerase|nr:diaminopimelate epimerase [Holosporaceae bacterium]
MLIKFDKMQSLGNDFVMIDLMQFPEKPCLDKSFFLSISNRNYGVGCDLTVLYKFQNSDIFAEFFNSDGSKAEICGNAARCLGFLMKKCNDVSKCFLRVDKRSYPIQVDGKIRVGMGQPSFDPRDVGLSKLSPDVSQLHSELNLPLDLSIYYASCVSIGNPHLILFCKNIPEEKKIISVGAQLENHTLFENRINVSFAQIISDDEIILSVFERGVGLTQACGSGACATVSVARAQNIISSQNVLVRQMGGSLMIHQDKEGNIFQSGPAFYVFSGEMEI